jgi:probable HAF family extracellular repeat protein
MAQHYTITDLGHLSPTAINAWGQVVGNLNNHAFMWTRTGGLKDLGVIPGGTFSSGAAINDLGVVTGTADGLGTISNDPYVPNQECSDLTQPFVWTLKDGMHGLGTSWAEGFAGSGCGIGFFGTGINDRSEVVGYTDSYGSWYQFGFLWTRAEGMTVYGGSWPPTFVNGISNTGQIVGQNGTITTFTIGHATSWKNGVATDLGTLGGGADIVDYSSSANGVNDLGQVVGWSTTTPISFFSREWPGAPVHAVLWMGSAEIRDLGTLRGDTLSVASKISFFGQVIGSSGNTAVGDWSSGPPYKVIDGHPFIWSERSGMRDLNTLVRGNSKWVLTSATDINVWGQIVGQGLLNGKPHGFLLTPRAFSKF